MGYINPLDAYVIVLLTIAACIMAFGIANWAISEDFLDFLGRNRWK